LAGGMRRGERGNLASRVAAVEPPSTPRSPARHCFVDDEPALLVEWRRGSVGWEGRVLSMSWIDAVGWATVERWLPASRVRGCEEAGGRPRTS
jgi:hypothetical protein